MNDPSDISKNTITSAPPKRTVSFTFNGLTVVKILLLILVVLVAFWLGVLYGDHHPHTTTTASPLGSDTGGFGSFRRSGGGLGTVTSVSSSSITIDNARTGASTTYTITSSTKVNDDGQSASVSSISDGDRVIVIPSSSNSKDAATIIVGVGGYSGYNQGSSTGSTSGSTTTQ